MHGTLAVTLSPSIMENSVFRQKQDVSFTRSVLTGISGNISSGGASRCLFGAPEPNKCKDLVREVELKSALAFGKRFNFDVIHGEPFPSAKKMKLSHDLCDDWDEENANLEEEKDSTEGYLWTDPYTDDFMATCNKHSVNTIVGPSRISTVSLLFAPIILHSNQSFTSSIIPQDSAVTSTSTLEESSPSDVPSPSSPLEVVSSPEANNNITTKKSHSPNVTERRLNRINSNFHTSHHYPQSAKKSSLSKAHHILSKYNRVLKHAVMKKPQKLIITDYMHVRRMKANSQQSGKKQ